MAFAEPGLFLRFAKTPLRLLDAIRPSAYGIFLVHYIFIIWLQYAVYDPGWSPFVKFAIVFAGTLAMSWGPCAAAEDSGDRTDDLMPDVIPGRAKAPNPESAQMRAIRLLRRFAPRNDEQ